MPERRAAAPEPLILPRGIRLSHPHELPEGAVAEQARLARANVTTGYRLHPYSGGGYTAYVEANAHATSLFTVFHDLVFTLLPREAAPIIATKDGETYPGPYTIRAAALRLFEPHIQVLQHDGFLAFGLISQHQGLTEEVFVQPTKYLQVWTNQPAAARAVFAQHRIPEVAQLQLVEQYPMVEETLLTPEGAATGPLVLEQVRAGFTALPRP